MDILKIPFDLGIIDKDKRGASKAPDLLASMLKAKHPSLKFVDVPVYEDFSATQESIAGDAVRALEKGKLLAIGGDHSITYPLARAFKEKYSNSCLIIFDAHSDCEEDFIPPSHEGVTRALATTTFSPDEILLVGWRKSRTKEEEVFIKKHDIKTLCVDGATAQKVLDFISNFDAFYLSIDIDVFDSEDAPGTGWPEPDGPDKSLLLNIFKRLNKSEKLKSVDLVEVSPDRDAANKTASLASDLLEIFATPKD